MNGLSSNPFRKFSLIDRICQCLFLTFLILGNVLLKVSASCKFLWVDGFSLSSNIMFRSVSGKFPPGQFPRWVPTWVRVRVWVRVRLGGIWSGGIDRGRIDLGGVFLVPFRSTLMALSIWWSRILDWQPLLIKPSLRSLNS